MDILAIYNAKGGVGKSTTAVNLAAALAEKGRRTLVIDLDAQGSSTQALGVRDEGRDLAEALTGSAALAPRPTPTAGVDLVPAGLGLAGLEKTLSREVGAEMILRTKLALLSGYDHVILDPPPGLGILSVGALVAASGVLVPVNPHPLALGGLAQMLQALDTVRERLNPRLELAGILLTMFDGRTSLAGQIEADLRARFGKKVLRAVIRQNVKIAEAAGHGAPVLAYDKHSNGAADYRALARERIKSLGVVRNDAVAKTA